ncbi:DUF1778 domain-containing protein [Mesorhizobium sp. M7A.F.Ca.CA.001.07.2.1]|uniref:type II toxin -antitoxin system TacA 1-like antitoxin n=1 Tax=Mesorhizobium TaxID=68287 RepID=UPI000FCA1D68|nr:MULTISPECIES: DUF1778 domain-containing protein [Mesorhizobium]RVB37715.1 DUF1778 domain-containing protein [Mesorhizobium sp. M7A.F.Ca.CA.004.05.1.1]MCF6126154.1 DUF1778 domain-containing protein [Mesorhizobium ciceri]MCQ8813811.1 DUF1778 domain-containing protein [Mesorhizobium sp. SEMIA396]MCQ8875842.1 DUF1778 domain-containing protein [Mesorhizobium sp. LMG17149]RUX68940.1 DUF1778 domain-containing protein [Mesorhizobium sp. M7A.F.Ca.CA.004.08.2.1]
MTKDRVNSTQEDKLMREERADVNTEGHSQLDLSVNDSRVFVEALINPRSVNDRLRDTVRRYRHVTGS